MGRSPELPRKALFTDIVKEMREPKTETDDGWVYVRSEDGEPLGLVDETSPLFANDWDHEGSYYVSFYLDVGGIVHMRGNFTGGVEDTIVFTLPEDYRPEYEQRFVVSNNPTGWAKVSINADGEVSVLEIIT